MGMWRRTQSLAVVVVAGMLLVGASCNNASTKGKLQSGSFLALEKAGQVAVQTSTVMNRDCPAGKIPRTTCESWNRFLPHFQFSYDQLAKNWSKGATGDVDALSAATASLVGEVLTYAISAGVPVPQQ